MLISHIIAFTALAIATIVDLKKREVPDTVSYATILLGIVLALFSSLTTNSYDPFITMASGMGVCFLIGAIMFFSGQWGGGDAKLIIGLGALFGATNLLYEFLLLTIIAGAVYGIVYGAYLAIKRKETFKKVFTKLRTNKKILYIRLVFQLVVVVALVFAIFFVQERAFQLTIVILATGSYLVFYAWMFSKALDECMKVKTPVNKLVEGDWVIEDMMVDGKKLDVANFGITKKQIDALKKNKVKKVLVKEGIPFVPSFMIAYLATIILHVLGISFISIIF